MLGFRAWVTDEQRRSALARPLVTRVSCQESPSPALMPSSSRGQALRKSLRCGRCDSRRPNEDENEYNEGELAPAQLEHA